MKMWEVRHEWWIDDIKFDLAEIWLFKQLLRMHPDDDMGEAFRELLKVSEGHLKVLLKEYKKIYGCRPNIRKLKEEIET